jgi:hypothetical protein
VFRPSDLVLGGHAQHHWIVFDYEDARRPAVVGRTRDHGKWFVRRLRPLAGRAVLIGHRHIDWIGECEGLLIVSAPSPVMEATDDLDSYFYIQTLAVGANRHLRLLHPQRITVEGQLAG